MIPIAKKLFNKDYILLLQSSAVSTIGDLMYSVAIGYWVFEQTGSSSLMGVMSAISMFVTMFLSPFSGSVIDKCNRKWVMVGMDLMQSAVMLTIGALAYLGKLTVPGVLLAAFLAALGSVFYSPATNTLLLDIIPRDDMVRGKSLFAGMNSLINTVGTAFSGVLVAFFGVPLIVVINGLSNLYAAVSELFIDVPRTAQQGEQVSVTGLLQDFSAAIKAILADPCLRLFVPSALLLNLLGAGPSTLILPFCMEKGLAVEKYGYFMTFFTAAYLICTLLLGVVRFSPKARFSILSLGFSGSVVFMSALYLSSSFLPMCVFGFIGAFLNCAGNAVFNASLMLALPEKNRGAILGFMQSASTGGMALSAVVYGVLGDVFPLYLVFVAGSALSLVPMLYLSFHPQTKKFVLEH